MKRRKNNLKRVQSKMRKKMNNGIAKGSLMFEMAEDMMDIIMKARLFKKMSGKK